MKKLLLIAAIIALVTTANAQTTPTLYHPEANAKAEIAAAVKKAAAGHKNVLLQIGGNWCSWCLRFNKLVTSTDSLNTYLNNNYEVVHVNYSKENMNEKLLAELGYPQRFGFPVFIILDDKGNRLHTQNSGYLEEGKGYSNTKVLEFFQSWSPAALDPKNYAEKTK
jgi:thioredoxin-related protein